MTLRRVPLFPLSTVLFPNMVMSLHIFEPRYRQMINRCADQDIPFGVVMVRPGSGSGGVVEPARVGTMARITEVDRMEDGRLNVVTVGVNRFRLHSVSREDSYLSGEIEFLDEAQGDPTEESALADQVNRLFAKYVELFGLLVAESGEDEEEDEDADEIMEELREEGLRERGAGAEEEGQAEARSDEARSDEADEFAEIEVPPGMETFRLDEQSDSHDGPDLSVFGDQPQLPRHPGSMAYLVAASSGWTLREKQELLEMPSAARRLDAEAGYLRRDVASMVALRRLRREGGRPPFIGPCSAN